MLNLMNLFNSTVLWYQRLISKLTSLSSKCDNLESAKRVKMLIMMGPLIVLYKSKSIYYSGPVQRISLS
jgi:hypothetical protein